MVKWYCSEEILIFIRKKLLFLGFSIVSKIFTLISIYGRSDGACIPKRFCFLSYTPTNVGSVGSSQPDMLLGASSGEERYSLQFFVSGRRGLQLPCECRALQLVATPGPFRPETGFPYRCL